MTRVPKGLLCQEVSDLRFLVEPHLLISSPKRLGGRWLDLLSYKWKQILTFSLIPPFPAGISFPRASSIPERMLPPYKGEIDTKKYFDIRLRLPLSGEGMG